MDCSQHKKYKAVKRPSNGCWKCWKMYLQQNPEVTIKGSDLYKLMVMLEI